MPISFFCFEYIIKIYKELERQLKEKKADLSTERVLEIGKTIYKIKAGIVNSRDTIEKILIINDE